jgi:hypothetical protein
MGQVIAINPASSVHGQKHRACETFVGGKGIEKTTLPRTRLRLRILEHVLHNYNAQQLSGITLFVEGVECQRRLPALQAQTPGAMKSCESSSLTAVADDSRDPSCSASRRT